MNLQAKFKNKIDIKLFIHKYIWWVVGILALLIFVFGYLLIIKPKINKGKADPNQSLESVTQDLKSWDEKLQKLNDLTTRFKAIPTSHLRRVQEFLPTEFEIPLLYVHLDALAKANDSALISVNVNDAGKKENTTVKIPTNEVAMNSRDFKLHMIDVSATFLLHPGNYEYEYYKGLIRNVENDLRLFDIESVDYSPDIESVQFKGKMYYLKNE